MKAAAVTTPGSTEVIDVVDPPPMDHEELSPSRCAGFAAPMYALHDGDYGVVRYPVIPGHGHRTHRPALRT